ncbi:MAG: hypothetical protein HYT70_00265 [Candidatus Aenigmarchaeota archaeon]|nr:hypothetical protein [Candidatus Aenigmarchaeota archaeon]
MVRSGRSISLDSRLWVEIEKFARDNNFPDISSAVESLLKSGIKSDKK